MEDYYQGELVHKSAQGSIREGNPMDVFSFVEWEDTPPSLICGRVAHLVWEYNGSDAYTWESWLTNICHECSELLDDGQNGCDTCIAFTRRASMDAETFHHEFGYIAERGFV